ncbi:hypothetical protein AGMMS4957_15300 [Bacteroidia bacterium]|nr:hypothetical protein AGMMS4957_15300 [Bacteroidia bacterium]
MKKRFGLFIVDDAFCVCLGGAFTMLCIVALVLGGIVLSGCTPEDDEPIIIPVESVIINNEDLSMETGTTALFSAWVFPLNASEQGIEWESDSPLVASINSSGLVTAHTAGNVIIVARSVDGHKTAHCAITVTNPKYVYGEWVSGVRYFPVRQVFINCSPSDVGLTVFDPYKQPPIPDYIDFYSVIDSVNVAFEDVGVQFYLAKDTVITTSMSFSNDSKNVYPDPGAADSRMINVYYVDHFLGMAGWGDYPNKTSVLPEDLSWYLSKFKIQIQYVTQADLSTLIHELGHFFGLKHVYDNPLYPNNYMGDGSSIKGAVFTADQKARMLECSFWFTNDVLVRGRTER